MESTSFAGELSRDPLAGTGHRAVRCIGTGASSEVFEAVTSRGELRAVKLLRPSHAASAEARARVDREVRALASIRSPHVVRVLDAGTTADGRPFITMERLVGESLRERLQRRRRLPVAEACGFLVDVLDGLEAAHRAGVIHRDVKPANIFLARDGRGRERAVLVDFGIARVDGAPSLTSGGHVLGTPRYLSPEQVVAGVTDGRTDVYASGLVLFEAIAGESAHIASGPLAAMLAHVRGKPRRLGELALVPEALDAAVARALEKSPHRRFPSARAFASALRAMPSAMGGPGLSRAATRRRAPAELWA